MNFADWLIKSLATLTFCFFVVICLAGPFIKFLKKSLYEQPIRDEECPTLGKLHEMKKHTPTFGGVLMLAAVTLGMSFFSNYFNLVFWICWFSFLAAAVCGGVDDFLKVKQKKSQGLAPRYKLLMQGIISITLAIYHYKLYGTTYNLWLPFCGDVLQTNISPIVLGLFYFLVIAGTSNAVNLTDGLDGLAAGCVFFVSISVLVACALSTGLPIDDLNTIVVFLAAIAGSCLGFLVFNCHPAKIFMGDVGSLALGTGLAVAAILIGREWLLPIAGFWFILETLSVIIQVLSFKIRKKRVFLCAPLHHHFEFKGIAETRVVICCWIICIFCLFLSVIGCLS